MANPTQSLNHFVLADCQVRVGSCTLEFADGTVKLMQPKMMEVLRVLARHYPERVSRETLIDSVWAGNYYVGEKALTNAIWHLRQALSTSAKLPDVIETQRGTGYRLAVAPNWQAPVLEPDANKTAPIAATRRIWPAAVLTAPVLLIAALLRYGEWQNSLAVSQLVVRSGSETVVSEPGQEQFPRPSPDRNWLAYVSANEQGQDVIRLLSLAQPDKPATTVAVAASTIGVPVWQPDSKALYVLAIHAGRCQLLKVSLADQTRLPLTDCEGSSPRQISLSPDGKQLAFLAPDDPAVGRRIGLFDLQQNTVTRRVPCVESCTPTMRDRDAEFSPDGRWLAISRRGSDQTESLHVVELASGKQRQLTDAFSDVRGMAWTPDSQAIVIGAVRTTIEEGWHIALAGGEPQLLAAEAFSYPAFSRNGDYLYFESGQNRPYIASLSVAGASLQAPFPLLRSGFHYLDPDYSAVSGALAFVSNESGQLELWTAKSDGSDRRQRTRLRAAVRFPRWSHDGRRIAYVQSSGNQVGNSLQVLDIASGQITELNSPFRHHKRPTWGRDDQTLLVAAGNMRDNNLYRLFFDGRPPLTVMARNVRMAIEMPDGQLLSSSNGLWLLPAADSSPTRLLPAHQFSEHYAWTVASEVVWYWHHENDLAKVIAYDLRTQQRQVRLEMPADAVDAYAGLSFLPEIPALLFTQSTPAERDIRRFKLAAD